MCHLHFLRGDGPADLLHVANVVHGIHLLDVLGLDLRKTKGVEAFAGKLGVVAQVGEKFRRIPDPLSDDVADFAIEDITGETLAEDAAEKILFGEGRAHERGGDGAGPRRSGCVATSAFSRRA